VPCLFRDLVHAALNLLGDRGTDGTPTLLTVDKYASGGAAKDDGGWHEGRPQRTRV